MSYFKREKQPIKDMRPTLNVLLSVKTYKLKEFYKEMVELCFKYDQHYKIKNRGIIPSKEKEEKDI